MPFLHNWNYLDEPCSIVFSDFPQNTGWSDLQVGNSKGFLTTNGIPPSSIRYDAVHLIAEQGTTKPKDCSPKESTRATNIDTISL
jgi:hypothetical protein